MNIFNFVRDEHFYHEYQPLFFLKESMDLYGYEALLRNSMKANPELLFQSATKANILYKLDTISIEKAIETFLAIHHSSDRKLFINIYITTMLHPNFIKFFSSLCHRYHDLPNRLLLEVNETSEEEYWNNALFKNTLRELRALGVRFAIDDFGKGTSSLKKAIEISPECIKLDRYFACNLSKDEQKQKFLSFFSSFYGNDTILVLEGIEEKEDLIVAQQLGLHVGQGYFLGKPKTLEAV